MTKFEVVQRIIWMGEFAEDDNTTITPERLREIVGCVRSLNNDLAALAIDGYAPLQSNGAGTPVADPEDTSWRGLHQGIVSSLQRWVAAELSARTGTRSDDLALAFTGEILTLISFSPTLLLLLEELEDESEESDGDRSDTDEDVPRELLTIDDILAALSLIRQAIDTFDDDSSVTVEVMARLDFVETLLHEAFEEEELLPEEE